MDMARWFLAFVGTILEIWGLFRGLSSKYPNNSVFLLTYAEQVELRRRRILYDTFLISIYADFVYAIFMLINLDPEYEDFTKTLRAQVPGLEVKILEVAIFFLVVYFMTLFRKRSNISQIVKYLVILLLDMCCAFYFLIIADELAINSVNVTDQISVYTNILNVYLVCLLFTGITNFGLTYILLKEHTEKDRLENRAHGRFISEDGRNIYVFHRIDSNCFLCSEDDNLFESSYFMNISLESNLSKEVKMIRPYVQERIDTKNNYLNSFMLNGRPVAPNAYKYGLQGKKLYVKHVGEKTEIATSVEYAYVCGSKIIYKSHGDFYAIDTISNPKESTRIKFEEFFQNKDYDFPKLENLDITNIFGNEVQFQGNLSKSNDIFSFIYDTKTKTIENITKIHKKNEFNKKDEDNK